MKRLLLAALPCALVAYATQAPAAPAPAPVLSHTPILNKLDLPWDMAFPPNGTMFFTEKCQGLSVRQPNGTVVKLLAMKDAKGYGTGSPSIRNK
jgi:glucose/arabinose dehydrogenase